VVHAAKEVILSAGAIGSRMVGDAEIGEDHAAQDLDRDLFERVGRGAEPPAEVAVEPMFRTRSVTAFVNPGPVKSCCFVVMPRLPMNASAWAMRSLSGRSATGAAWYGPGRRDGWQRITKPLHCHCANPAFSRVARFEDLPLGHREARWPAAWRWFKWFYRT
jgi:hypothetical protein